MQFSIPSRYRILRELGRGGQGSVWLALDRLHANARVALKVVRESGSDPQREDLAREFLMLSRLAHPHIARVRDFGWLRRGKAAYFTSDFVAGKNLLEGSLGVSPDERWKRLIHVAFQVLSVLQYLSLRGVRHGDLKPANILVEDGPEGPRSKVIDFGTARLRAQGGDNGEGTPAYLPPPESDADPDLYALGMTLFHAGVGRLPFALGEPDALEAWWRNAQPASPRAADPAAPAILDELVRGLTAPRGPPRLRSAAEAVELLRRTIALPPPARPLLPETLSVMGREEIVDELTQEVMSPPWKVHVVSGPHGIGKTGVLEALEARLQARGLRTVLFSGIEDPKALRAAEEILADLPGGDAELAVLIDDAPDPGPSSGAGAAFLRVFAHRGQGQMGRMTARSAPIIAAATSDIAALADRLGVAERELRVHALDPLSRESIRDIAREFFAVESIPEEIAKRIEEESGGAPARVGAALETLAAAGAAADFLGCLKLPGSLPDRLVSGSPEAPPSIDDLAPQARRALGLLRIAGQALDPAAAHARFPDWSREEWSALLESLRSRGYLRRDGGRGEPLYRLAPSASLPIPAAIIGPEAEHEARSALAARLDEIGAESPETLLAAARNRLALGHAGTAVRRCLRAAKDFLRAKELPEDPSSLLEIATVPLPAEDPGTRRAQRALRLRAAELLERLAAGEDVLSLLQIDDDADPPWYRRAARILRAEILEKEGELTRAIAELESMAGAAPGRGDGDGEYRLDSLARLATLYFRAGRPKQGREAMESGRRLLQDVRSGRGPPGSRAAVLLGLFARAEAAHGDADRAMDLLETSLGIARGLGRQDLALGPLNELGILYGQHQRWPEALRVFEEIERAARGRGDGMGALKAIYNRAIIHYRLQELDCAETLFREARALSADLGRHSLEAAILLGLAGVLRERGRLLPALRLYRKVIGERTRARPNDRAVAHGNIREIYLLLGRLDRSMLHAGRAFRIARSVESKFLMAMTLRFRGITRWALGNAAGARRDLERALSLARKERDARGQGLAWHYLGLLAARTGDLRETVSCLRSGITASRSAGDLPHLHAGIAALLAELLRRGRRKAARRILGDGARSASWARGTAAARVLAIRSSPGWPANHAEAIEACREASRKGMLWDAFRALTDALLDPALTPEASQAFRLAREGLSGRILRHVPPRHESSFRSFWGLATPSAEEAAEGEGPSAGSMPSPARGPSHPAGGGDSLAAVRAFFEEEPRSLRALADDLRIALGAEGVWVLRDDAAGPPWIAAGREGGLERLLSSRGPALAKARAGRELMDDGAFLCLGLPGTSPSAVLCAAAPASGWSDPDEARRRFLERAGTFGLALHVVEAEEALRRERSRSEAADGEVRRMNVLATRGMAQLETALMTKGLEVLHLRRQLEETNGSLSALRRAPAGSSPALKAIISRLPRLAAIDIPILLLGESGVGKDMIARWLHDLGPRRERPFAAETCNIPETLMEAELFGFVRGAFTDAVKDRAGLFERVNGGTLYLDEIADLAPTMQARLLRVLEEKEVRPIGAEAALPVDFRLISSSRLSLEELESGDRIRRDLLYRVKSEVLFIPPLRERKEDIRSIVEAALEDYSRRSGAQAPYVEPGAWEKLLEHPWPGNVRELLNEVDRALVGKPLEITAEMLLPVHSSSFRAETVPALRDERGRVEKDLLVRALRAHGGNASRAARALGVTRRYLGTLLRKHHLELKGLREGVDAPKAAGPAGSAAGRKDA